MLKALLKKQLLEFVSGFILKGNGEKRKSNSSKAVLLVVFFLVFASFMSMFFMMAYMMTEMITAGYSWLYFAIFGILSSLMGIFGSVFMTYNTLYEAKDNDLLLSMPIPSWMILFSRTAGLYLTAFFFEALVSVPAFIVYLSVSAFSPFAVVFGVVNIFVLPILSIVVSCILGWGIAFFAAKIRNKSIITVLFSLAFFAVYYFCSMKMNTIINMIMMNVEAVGEWIKKYLYLFWHMGHGCSGNGFSFFIYVGIVLLLFAVIYVILSCSFLKLATAKKGMKKIRYVEKKAKQTSAKAAFFKKELLFFKNTPPYILNCGLGSLMMLIFAIFSAIKSEELINTLSMIGIFPASSIPVIMGIAMCFVSSTNNISSVSVSLEGKNLWLLKSVPADTEDIFFGKLMLHITVTGIPLLISDVIIAAAFGADLLMTVLIIIFSELFMTVCAEAGLIANLLFPKTEWTNVTVPIKQSLSAMIGMFSGLFFSMAVIAVFYIFSGFLHLHPYVFLIVSSIVFILISLILYKWINSAGKERFFQL